METWDGSVAEVSEADLNGVITIETAEELAGLAEEVNLGNTFEGVTIKLDCDMDMANRTWTPIGMGNRSSLGEANVFKGTFDGNNKKIVGLSNKGYVPAEENKVLEGDFSETVYTYHYGLFGITENATIKNLTVTVDFDCEEESLKGDSVGAIVGFANKGLTIDNCVANGEVEGYDAIGGLVGRTYYSNQSEQVYIKDSTNNVKVTGLFKAAGILGYISSANFYATIDGCVNNGTISVKGVVRSGASQISFVAGVLTYGWTTTNNTLIVINNVNNGTLNACETLSQELPNVNAYASIGTSTYNQYNKDIHSYNFNANENNGTVYYLGEQVSDALLIVLSQAYPEYESSWEANNTTNIQN
ncbi:MAG: hypothetical protein IJ310_00265 [Clostridia bacterium]|nr:hypothetical protein [Clostridia bacterium]